MTMACIESIGMGEMKMLMAIASFAIAMLIMILIKMSSHRSTKLRVSLIYAHLISLFFPFVLFSINTTCGMLCMSCYNNLSHLISYVMPATLTAGTLAGFVVLPYFFIFSSRRREITGGSVIDIMRKYSSILSIKVPKAYLIDKQKPIAFSFRSFRHAIFISVGMLEMFRYKEIEAVLLHEMSHIARKASALKFSSSMLRLLSPLSILSGFSHDSDADERRADKFAYRMQGTWKYVKSAKRKMSEYDNSDR